MKVVILPVMGVAVVNYDKPDDRGWICMDGEDDMPVKPLTETGLRLSGIYEDGMQVRREFLETDDLDEVRNRLCLLSLAEDALRMILRALDDRLEEDNRHEAIRCLDEHMVNDREVCDKVVEWFSKVPVPDYLIEGAPVARILSAHCPKTLALLEEALKAGMAARQTVP